jgi:putative PIN family toxin of toxin-antitoxin system
MKVFVDTNVLISAYYFKGNERKLLQLIIDKEITGVISPNIIVELKNIMINKFKENKEDTEKFVEKLLSVMDLTSDYELDVEIRHEKDKTIVGSAVISECDYLITGDNDILELKKYNKLKIMNASKFLNDVLINK